MGRTSLDRRVGTALRRERERRNLTLKRVADKAGVDLSQLSKMERGLCGMNLATLDSLARALGVPLESLLVA